MVGVCLISMGGSAAPRNLVGRRLKSARFSMDMTIQTACRGSRGSRGARERNGPVSLDSRPLQAIFRHQWALQSHDSLQYAHSPRRECALFGDWTGMGDIVLKTAIYCSYISRLMHF